APRDGLRFAVGKRHDLVDQSHVERLPRVVLLAQEPDLARFLLPDDARQQACSIATIEAPDARTGLAEASVVRGDGEVAYDVQHVAAADRIAGDHRDHGLWQAADLDLQVEHIEPAGALRVDVAVVSTHALVAARAERFRPGTGRSEEHTSELQSPCNL